MYPVPNICRVCLKYDRNLIDLAHIENEPSDTLLSKLQLCVSEVDWDVNKPVLCHPCIKRLNIAYGFKKQCMQSASVLKNYAQIVKDSQNKSQSSTGAKVEGNQQFMVLPNQKFVKILVGNQGTGANSFQNVFLNLIPSTTITTVPSITKTEQAQKNKDTNQNVFVNLQKFIPIAPNDVVKKADSQDETEAKPEELSVELNPLDFTLEEQDEQDSPDDQISEDYDDIIKQIKIGGKKEENGLNGNKKGNQYVPILPKQGEDFSNSGQHFLFAGTEKEGGDFTCESCSKCFSSMRYLKQHIKMFHLGKMPFKCQICYVEYAVRADYEICLKAHQINQTPKSNITLKDLEPDPLRITDIDDDLKPTENGDYRCDVCKRTFNSSSGLLRHKVRKHNQKNKKKYFIKGMKNARCDICNREFSTQSYMQLHRKLHLRDDIGYKYKVFGKSKYQITEEGEENSETADVTPDVTENEGEAKNDHDFKEGDDDDDDDDEYRLKMDIDENDDHSENEESRVINEEDELEIEEHELIDDIEESDPLREEKSDESDPLKCDEN